MPAFFISVLLMSYRLVFSTVFLIDFSVELLYISILFDSLSLLAFSLILVETCRFVSSFDYDIFVFAGGESDWKVSRFETVLVCLFFTIYRISRIFRLADLLANF